MKQILKTALLRIKSDLSDFFSGNTSYPFCYPDKGKQGGKIFPEDVSEFRKILDSIFEVPNISYLISNQEGSFNNLRDEMFFYYCLLLKNPTLTPTRSDSERGQRICTIVSNMYLNAQSPLFLKNERIYTPAEFENKIIQKISKYSSHVLGISKTDFAKLLVENKSLVTKLITDILTEESKNSNLDSERKANNVLTKIFDFFVYTVSIENEKKGQDVAKTDEFAMQNILLVGPPGTGKTRAAAVIATEILGGTHIDLDPNLINYAEPPKDFLKKFKLNYFSTQFHPSFSYEDFFEGLRPISTQTNDRSDVAYTIVPGVFKVVCQLAHAYLNPGVFGINIDLKFLINEKGVKTWLFSECLNHDIYNLLERDGYFSFNNKIIGTTGNESQKKVDEDSFPSASGAYSTKWYYSGSEKNIEFVLFIDELNRGNPARVFGEALSLIEPTKRFDQPEQANIILPYSHESFSVPPNISVICAMNSSDKSLATLDHAFRRRFKFVYLAPSFEIITSDEFKKKSKNIFSDTVLNSAKNHFQAINDALKSTGISQESYIGHSYLINILRAAYSADDKYKQGNVTQRRTVEQLVGYYLIKTWEDELHGLIRDIVGDHKLKDFCENFALEVKNLNNKDTMFLAINEDIAASLFKYLDKIQPTRSIFPWKKVA